MSRRNRLLKNGKRFSVRSTRIRALHHLELYSPKLRRTMRFFWKYFPRTTLKYFASIFAYDYEVFVEDKSKNKSSTSTRPEYRCHGVLGIECADPFGPLRKTCERLIGFVVLFLFFIIRIILIPDCARSSS